MEREHLIIIALILVALYMMNTDKKQDKVQAISPMGRIRYGNPLEGGAELGYGSHIRTRREGFEAEQDIINSDNAGSVGPGSRIRYSDKSFAHSQHIKNHIRSRNTNSMFSGMTTGSCGPMASIEKFRMEECVGQDCYGQS